MSSSSPNTPENYQLANDIAMLALAQRLAGYAKHTNNPEMHCDLKIAASLINYVVRSTDDYK